MTPKQFLESLKAQLHNTASITNFIETETYLNGRIFSWDGHEYQKYISELVEKTPGIELIVMKCSQIGLSEIITRIELARMAIRPGTSVLLSFPSRTLSSEIFKTRWNPILAESPRLRTLVDPNTDSASVKMFINNSAAYALSGNAASKSSLISRPISDVVVDEVDRQEADIVNSYGSRTTHTPHDERVTIKLSTPTAEGVGVDAEIAECREVHEPYIVCEHCGEEFQPDFFTNVKIPGYYGTMLELTKRKAAELDLNSSYLECPRCKGDVKKRNYIWKIQHIPTGTANKIGVKLTPFIAPAFIRMADLVISYLTFTDRVEFLNQKLGLPASLKDSALSLDDISFVHTEDLRGRYVLGLDMGKLCHLFVGVRRRDMSLHIIEAEVVKLAEIEDKLCELTRRYAFTAMVMDSQPYSDLVYKLVRLYPRLYSAIYVDPVKPIPELYLLKMKDKHNEIVRQITINKNPAFDLMASDLRGLISFAPMAARPMIQQHLLDMRRVRDYSSSVAGSYKWVKSRAGEDHFFHALLYTYMAGKLAEADLVSDIQIPVKIGRMKLNH
jgi:hypothetical protein